MLLDAFVVSFALVSKQINVPITLVGIFTDTVDELFGETTAVWVTLFIL